MEDRKAYLLLWGGVDVNPEIYKHNVLPQTQKPNLARDAAEFKAVSDAFNANKPVIGVCRGAQLLCVANGGTLYQHSEDHGGPHAIDTSSGMIANVQAGHHQIMNLDGIDPEDYQVLAWTPFHTKVWNQDGTTRILEASPEVVWFPRTKSLAIQPHPEWAGDYHPFNKWLSEVIQDKLNIRGVF